MVLLLPASFAFTGRHTQIGLVYGAAEWMACALIIAGASAGKFGGAAIAARLGRGMRDSSPLVIMALVKTFATMPILHLIDGALT